MSKYLYVAILICVIIFNATKASGKRTLPVKVGEQHAIDKEQAKAYFSIADDNQGYGVFQQDKYFTIMLKPFKTSGNFLFLGSNLIWKTEQPVLSVFILKQEIAYSVSSQGQVKQETNAGSFGDILKGIFQSNFDRLDEIFFFHPGSQDNCLILSAKNEQIKSIFLYIEVCGGEFVESIFLYENSGNRTEIRMKILDADKIPVEWKNYLIKDNAEFPNFAVKQNPTKNQ